LLSKRLLKWQAADPTTKVPGLALYALTAQGELEKGIVNTKIYCLFAR
jgi:hypothetical protein